MKKRKIIMLSIGITLIVITFIASIIWLIYNYIYEKDPINIKLIFPVWLFLIFPIVLEELSLLRSVYKLVNYNSRTIPRVCYIISAILVFLSLVFQILVFTKIITESIFPEGPRAASSRLIELLLFSEWPVIIISFLLGSL